LNSFFDFFYVFFTSFFLYPHTSYFHRNNLNNLFMETVDLDFSMSLIPLFILILFFFNLKKFFNNKNFILYIILFLILIIPIFFNVNIYNSKNIISNIPIFKSFWINIRWMAVYIFPVILFVGIVINKIKINNKFVLLLIFLVILQTITYHKIRNIFKTNYFVNGAVYDISEINNYSMNVKDNINNVKIEYVQMWPHLIGNEGYMYNTSNYYCYSPIFGYRLEYLPFNNIMNFQVHKPQKELKNYLFNPACFLYPDENFCKPGDLFRPDQDLNLYKFINFNNYDFNIPFYQKISNYISLIVFMIISFMILFLFLTLIIAKILLRTK